MPLQALCKDEIIPQLKYFGKGFGPNDEPRRAYVLSFLVAAGCVLIGKYHKVHYPKRHDPIMFA